MGDGRRTPSRSIRLIARIALLSTERSNMFHVDIVVIAVRESVGEKRGRYRKPSKESRASELYSRG